MPGADTAGAPRRNYADSHPVVRVSAKRFLASPFLARYATDDVVFGVYGGRLYPLSHGPGEDAIEAYWRLRRQAVLFDVPERPLEIAGPDAARLLDRVLARDLRDLPVGRARYAIACARDGGILMDGVVVRLAAERYWYVLADGEIEGWLDAHAAGLDVTIRDPGSWVLQVQGPASLRVLADACGGALPTPFAWFDAAHATVAGQPVLVTRTGWSGELGFEVYTLPETDADALWDGILAAGAPHGLASRSLEALGIRRIEAGILDNGTDIDRSMTPFAAGLGRLVDLASGRDYVGREALARADRGVRLHGVASAAVPVPGMPVLVDGEVAGRVTAGAWSPALRHGIGYVVLGRTGDWPGREVVLGERGAPAAIVPLPYYDAERRLPRGLPLAATLD